MGLAGVVFVLAAGWWLERSTRPPEAAPVPELKELTNGRHSSPPITGGGSSLASPTTEAGETAAEKDPAAAADAKPSVGDILAMPDDDYVRVAGKLLKITLDPNAEMVEREEALAHALNLSAGNEAEVLTPLVVDKNLPDAFAETVLAEALNRPLDFQADLYLAALGARTNEELKLKIREHLAFLTGGDDLGSNPADWKKAIQAAKDSWPK